MLFATWSLSLPLLLGAVQENPDWKPFASERAGFTIAFPSPPKESKQRVQAAAGELEVLVFVSEEKNDTSFVVSCSDVPESASGKETIDKRLDFARDGAAANSRGKLRTEKKIEREGHPGRDLVIDHEDTTVVRLRLFVVGRRLYQVMVIGPGTVATSRDVTFFLDSFRVNK